MIAKVMHNNSVYYSPVFAVSFKMGNSKVVVFDSSFSQLIVVPISKGQRYTTLFMDYNTENFSINEESFKSYWGNRNIFKIIKNKKYTPEMLEEAREILKQIKPQEFTKVKSKADCEALEINTGSFHDGYILAMKEKNDTLEILFDTSWGSLAILRCKGIIENGLDIGYVFYHCDINIDNDGTVTFLLNAMSHYEECVFKAKEVQFKPLFEKRIPLTKFEYTLENRELAFECDNQTIRISKTNNDILDFTERNVLGYFQDDEIMQRCFIFSEEIVYSFHQYIEKKEKANPKVAKFKEKCEHQGFVFDSYPLDDYFEEYEYDYGELIYSYQYKKLNHFINVFKISISTLFLYNLLILSIQLFNPQMKWGFYFVFGLGNSLFAFLISLIAVLKNAEHKYIEIYENGVKYHGYNTGFNIDYENITKVKYNNKIVLYTSIGEVTLHKSKQDKYIFELINERVSQKRKNNELNEKVDL